MKEIIDSILEHPVATAMVICSVTLGVANVVRAARTLSTEQK